MGGRRVAGEYEPGSGFVLRTPLLPFDWLIEFGAGVEAPSRVGSPGLPAALERDRARGREALVRALERRDVREAIRIASPALEQAIDHWRVDPSSKEGRKAERALLRYVLRMCARATPFGLFAACSTGRIGPVTSLRLEGDDACRRSTRLDMGYLGALCEGLGRETTIRRGQAYTANTTLHFGGGRVRATRRGAGTPPTYARVSAGSIAALFEVLEGARQPGGERADRLVERLRASDPRIGEEAAWGLVEEMIDAQLLAPRLAPLVTGSDSLGDLIETLSGIDGGRGLAERLERAGQELSRIDQAGPGRDPSEYRVVVEALRPLPATIDPARLFHVDLARSSGEATLGDEVLREARRGLGILHRLFGPDHRDALEPFRRAFARRYDRQEVPLLEALDPELGLGFPAATTQEPPRSPLGTWIVGRLQRAVAGGEDEIEIEEPELDAVVGPGPPLPGAIGLLLTIAASSDEAIGRGEFDLHLRRVEGPSGVNLVGRFAHLDPSIESLLRQHIAAEEALQPGAIHAEVVHLPDDRTGNILLRPVLREYELPILARSGAPAGRTIALTDLTVRLVDGLLELRSTSLDRPVVPRLTAAHVYRHESNLDLYRFLCLLQRQNVAHHLSWRWGSLADLPYLPRIRSGRLVLAPARWNLTGFEIREMTAPGPDEPFERFQRWRGLRRLPRYVVLAEEDRHLAFDLDHVLCVEALLDRVAGRDGCRLEEDPCPPDRLCVRGPGGRFAHEILLPLVHRSSPGAATDAASAGRSRVDRGSCRRRFPPGSGWAYLKLYAGLAEADALLVDRIGPLARELLSSSAIVRWFFVRFTDPDPHLRVRFEGDPESLRQRVLPSVFDIVEEPVADGRIWRVQLDTYEREIERFGGPVGVQLAERIFHADSEAVVDLLGEPGSGDRDARRLLALLGLDRLLDDLRYDLPGRKRCLEAARDRFADAIDADARREIDSRFRGDRPRIEALLEAGPPADPLLARGHAHFARRSERLSEVMGQVREAAGDGRLTVRLDALVGSLLHLHVNRLRRSTTRREEHDLYDALARLASSRLARDRQRPFQG